MRFLDLGKLVWWHLGSDRLHVLSSDLVLFVASRDLTALVAIDVSLGAVVFRWVPCPLRFNIPLHPKEDEKCAVHY